MTTTLRTQDEILKRYYAALRRNTEAEAFEYLRQMEFSTAQAGGVIGVEQEDEVEDYRDIERIAKTFLGNLLRNITACHTVRIADCISQFVAWKWMLKHPDADKFLGAHGEPPYCDPRRVYVYLREQIEGGEWDRLTRKSVANTMKGIK